PVIGHFWPCLKMKGKCARFFLVLLLSRGILRSQNLPEGKLAALGESATTRVEQLYQARNWSGILELIPESSQNSPHLDFYRGMALAHLERWNEAESSLVAGKLKAPADKRFPVELAGIAFQQRDLEKAQKLLLLALRIDPTDRYSSDFLATVYFLRGNAEAA